MSRVIIKEYVNSKEVLKFPEHTSTTVTVSDAGVKAVDGKKVVPAGTIIGGKSKPVLLNPEENVEDKNTEAKGKDAEGVLLYDVDVTNGPRSGAMVIGGYIDLKKIPAAPHETVDIKNVLFLK